MLIARVVDLGSGLLCFWVVAKSLQSRTWGEAGIRHEFPASTPSLTNVTRDQRPRGVGLWGRHHVAA